MAHIGKSIILGVFAAWVLLLGSCSHASDDAAAPAAIPDQEAAAKWLDRSQKYAASLPEVQLADVLTTLCGPMVAAGKDENLNRLVATIKDKERRCQQEVLICSALALAGKYDAAIRRAQSLPTKRRKTPSGGTPSWSAGATL